jgi:hypothetical protein
VFKIQKVFKEGGLTVIKLKYGELAKTLELHKKGKNLTKEEEGLVVNY